VMKTKKKTRWAQLCANKKYRVVIATILVTTHSAPPTSRVQCPSVRLLPTTTIRLRLCGQRMRLCERRLRLCGPV
jgi:hypothetical protein